VLRYEGLTDHNVYPVVHVGRAKFLAAPRSETRLWGYQPAPKWQSAASAKKSRSLMYEQIHCAPWIFSLPCISPFLNRLQILNFLSSQLWGEGGMDKRLNRPPGTGAAPHDLKQEKLKRYKKTGTRQEKFRRTAQSFKTAGR